MSGDVAFVVAHHVVGDCGCCALDRFCAWLDLIMEVLGQSFVRKRGDGLPGDVKSTSMAVMLVDKARTTTAAGMSVVVLIVADATNEVVVNEDIYIQLGVECLSSAVLSRRW